MLLFRTRGLAPLIWHSYASAQAKIHFLLVTAWQLAPIKVSMLNGQMYALSNCYVSGQDSPAVVD